MAFSLWKTGSKEHICAENQPIKKPEAPKFCHMLSYSVRQNQPRGGVLILAPGNAWITLNPNVWITCLLLSLYRLEDESSRNCSSYRHLNVNDATIQEVFQQYSGLWSINLHSFIHIIFRQETAKLTWRYYPHPCSCLLWGTIGNLVSLASGIVSGAKMTTSFHGEPIE